MLACLALETRAAAEPEQNEDVARQSFLQGVELSRQESWPAARAAFERSNSLRPHPVTIYNLAFCERALGQWTRAHRDFGRALSSLEPALPRELAESAHEYLQEAQAQLGSLKLVQPPGGSSIAVDGAPLEPTSADERARFWAGSIDAEGSTDVESTEVLLLLNPGRHVVVFARKGFIEQKLRVDIGPSQSAELSLRAWQSETPGPTQPASLPRKETAAPQLGSSSSAKALRTAGVVVGAAGVAALATGGVFMLRAFALNADSNRDNHCSGDDCDPQGYALRSDAVRMTHWATGFAIGGAALCLGGGVMYWFGARTTLTVSALSSPSAASVTWQQTF